MRLMTVIHDFKSASIQVSGDEHHLNQWRLPSKQSILPLDTASACMRYAVLAPFFQENFQK
jgi:hypothetical protein